MRKFQYFELSEFIKSETAKKKGIDNAPTFEIVDHLSELVREILDPLRAAYGKSITISSGYRCPALNKAVNGATTSIHMTGYAADLQVSGSFAKFRDFVRTWLKETGKKYDQLIVERNKKTGAQWIHIGLYNNSGQQRCQDLTMEVSK